MPNILIGGSESIGFTPRVDPVGSVGFQTNAHDIRDVLIAGKLKENGRFAGVNLRGTLDRAVNLGRGDTRARLLIDNATATEIDVAIRSNGSEVATQRSFRAVVSP
jgi:hypothetical protein